MIYLDTCVMIELTHISSPIGADLIRRARGGELLFTSAVSWSEFCNGPISASQKDLMFSTLSKITDFTWVEAEEAARLFNLTGRRRGSHADCMIAAAALIAGIPLATLNEKDFVRFTPYGLNLAKID